MRWWPFFRTAKLTKAKQCEKRLERETMIARHRNLQAVEGLQLAIKNSPELVAVKRISGYFK